MELQYCSFPFDRDWVAVTSCLQPSQVTSRRNVKPSLCSGTLPVSLNDTFLIGMPGPCHLAPASCWLQASEHILYQTCPVINRCLYCTINSVHFNKFPVVLTQSPFLPYLTPLCQALYNLCVCFSILLSAPSKFPLSHQVTVAFGSHLNITFSIWNSFSFTRPTLLSPALSMSRLPTCSNLSRTGPCLSSLPLCFFHSLLAIFRGLCSSFVAICWRRLTKLPWVLPRAHFIERLASSVATQVRESWQVAYGLRHIGLGGSLEVLSEMLKGRL